MRTDQKKIQYIFLKTATALNFFKGSLNPRPNLCTYQAKPVPAYISHAHLAEQIFQLFRFRLALTPPWTSSSSHPSRGKPHHPNRPPPLLPHLAPMRAPARVPIAALVVTATSTVTKRKQQGNHVSAAEAPADGALAAPAPALLPWCSELGPPPRRL
jgi:hypothetical protein